jgi:hypothetical protein
MRCYAMGVSKVREQIGDCRKLGLIWHRLPMGVPGS